MEQLFAQYTAYTTHVTGRTLDPTFTVEAHDRGYFVWLPRDYDSRQAYRVTFLFTGCGDRNAANIATYHLMTKDPESIYVAMNMPPAGLPPSGRDCYDTDHGKQSVEWEFMGLTAGLVQNDFCVDENRLFVAGYGSGASLANMLGCYFAGRDSTRAFGKDISVRGQASVRGAVGAPDVSCGGQIAALWLDDLNDRDPLGDNAQISLPRVLAVNGCTGGVKGPHAAWADASNDSSDCQQFTACPADYPVIFCALTGPQQTDRADLVVPGFVAFENLLNPSKN